MEATNQMQQLIDNKKDKLVTGLSFMLNGEEEFDEDSAQELALNWMELADQDGNGTLDYKEFYNFFSKIQEFGMSDEDIKQIFDANDNNGNGNLDSEEFGLAIY